MSKTSIMDTLFQRSLDDLIKGIRLHCLDSSSSPSTFISKALDEIRRELKSTDPHTKSTALLKLTYLHSFNGFDMSFASFATVEVLSYPSFPLKRIGYSAATASFTESTDVILLVTNQFRKDLSSPNDFEVTLPLHCLSVIGTTDLFRDLSNEIFVLLGTSRVYVRKMAVALLFRMFGKYPDAVRVCFKRLVENLESSDVQCVGAAVGVFCELSLRDPKAYLPLAPEFYRVLLECKNNWVLIKVLKIFSKLAPLEPRLANKVVDPICEIMRRTMAKSLLFECIRTVVVSLSEYESAVKLAVVKIREFLCEDDPNLKYLGLQALSDLVPRHLWAVLENKEAVIKSLSDVDPNIKLVSLRLIMSMVSEDNVAEIAKILLNYALKSDPGFCNEILRSILATCSRNYYEIVFDFDWYVSLLGDMSRILHCQIGDEIENQIVDIGMRVKDARPELVNVARDLLIDPALLGNPCLHRILSAAAWVSGEYVEYSKNPFELMEALLQPRTDLLPPCIRAVYIQSAFKVLVFCLQSYHWQSEEVGLNHESELQIPDGSVLATQGDVGEPEQVVKSSARASIELVDESEVEVGKEAHSSLVWSGKEFSAGEFVRRLLNLTETGLVPLSVSHDVEVQERARNVLSVVQLVKEAILGCSVLHDESSRKKEFDSSGIAGLIYDMFSEEIGPVSVNAQARIPIPDDLMLKDNLSDLDTIFSDMELHPSTSFCLGASHSRQKEVDPLSNGQCKEDMDSSSKSESSLALHRKRHGLYYLRSDKDDSASNDYPPANESKDQDNEVNDLVKLTEQTLILKKKPNHAKPRPVVKLDEAENFIPTKKLEKKEDILSGAVRDVLLGSKEVSTSSGLGEAPKSDKRKGKDKQAVDGPVGVNDSSVKAETSDFGNRSSRRSKHKTHGKERKHRSHGELDDGNKEISRKEKKKTSHHRASRDKAQQNLGGTSISVQTSPIPDFLL